MTVSQFFLIVRARWRSALIVFAGVLAVALAFTLLLPRNFTATGSVVLDVKSPDPIAGLVLPGMTVSGYMATQVDVLQSERVMLRAINELRLDQDPQLRASWMRSTDGQGSFQSWLAEQMGKALDARPSKESNVIVVSYTSRNRQVAADTVNAVIGAYIATTLELRTEPAKEFNAFFDQSTKKLREALEVANSRFSAFQQNNGIVVSDEKLDIENARLADLSTQMVQLQAIADQSGSRESQAVSRGDQMAEVITNPAVMSLTTDLARARANLREIEERYGDQYPKTVEARASIRELSSRLDVQKARIVGSLGVNNASDKSRLASLSTALETQRAKVLHLKGLRDDAAVLRRDVENAQRSYDAAFVKRSQSTLESQATQTNVSLIKNATPPAAPSFPRVNLNLAVALLLALVLGLATAVFREYRDWRLRTDSDVLDALKQPLLGVLPRRAGTSGSTPRALPAAVRRVLGSPALEQQ
jgi:succinoglycan biosynthesis transport protein ExoP